MEEEETEPTEPSWLAFDSRRPVLYDQRRKIWGFHVLHMTGDTRNMKGARQHPYFHGFMYVVDTIVGYTMMLFYVLILALAMAVFVWIGIHLH